MISMKELLEWELEHLNRKLEEITMPEKMKNDKRTYQIIDYWWNRGRKSAVLDLLSAAECLKLLGEKK